MDFLIDFSISSAYKFLNVIFLKFYSSISQRIMAIDLQMWTLLYKIEWLVVAIRKVEKYYPMDTSSTPS